MNLWEMSFAGGVLILTVIVLRSLALNRLPKGMFLALWAVAAVRLLIPFSIPSPASIYTLAENVPVQNAVRKAEAIGNASPVAPIMPGSAPVSPAAVSAPESGGTGTDVWFWVWLAGMVICAAYFLTAWLRCRREFRSALPVEDQQLQGWLAGQKLRRQVALRRSDRVDAPLTYGLLRPVILLPKDWADGARDRHCAASDPTTGPAVPLCGAALEHEMVHIRRLDALWKPLLAITACVHWFNPLVWCMFVLANRDMELRCDEAVVRRLGLDRRRDYALALISLEEKRRGPGPFASAFSKNAIEERIVAIMKLKKRSLTAILVAVVLVCCVGVGFATSAAKKAPYPNVEEGSLTKAELDRLSELWFDGFDAMTVAEYQQKMWEEWDGDEALIDRYRKAQVQSSVWNDEVASAEHNAFSDYFHNVYAPLTAGDGQWRTSRTDGIAMVRLDGGGFTSLEYTAALRILDPDRLTVGEYRQIRAGVEAAVNDLLVSGSRLTADDFVRLSQELSTDCLEVTVEAGLPVWTFDPSAGWITDPDAAPYADTNPDWALHAQASAEAANSWDDLLSPYAPFGLTWEFNDPDLDGNGLTMWFQGKEVRGIMDEQEKIWITEHTGNSTYSDGAVELYTVYTDGVLSGLRLATAEEQAGFDESREQSSAERALINMKEQREFPQATEEDYASLLTLHVPGSYQLSLEKFNERILNWANANGDAWDRINCDILWGTYDAQLSPEEKAFVSQTVRFSGTENGQMIRALHTDRPEQDPGFSASMPERCEEENGSVSAWCDLYYNISYHVSDKSKVTVAERDACVSGMLNAISAFWQDTDFETLLQMTEEDMAAQFNLWAVESSTENVKINPITTDDIHFEPYDERGRN